MAGPEQRNPAAFLSYAHADDHEGGVTRFVEHLNREISLQLGNPFHIFRDRDDLKWGDNWERRIDESLDSVTFLVAVLSPSFLGSEECVREAERFLAREGELGRDDLVFPVVWIKPDEIIEERRELWDLLWRRQNTNWERFRHHRSPYPVTALRQIEALARAVNKAIRRVSGRSKTKATSPGPLIKTPASTGRKVERPSRKDAKEDVVGEAALESPRSPKPPGDSPVPKGGRTSSREGVGVLDGVPEILWRPIPEGEVEIRDHGRFPVKPLHMAAFPVTNAQFQAFLGATDGYRNDRWWEGLSVDRDDRTPKEPRWKDPDHPRETVSWFEAAAFCGWLTDKLGFEIRLPDEQEWQWAAQSANPDFAYPWGLDWKDGAANTAEAGIGRTAAVTAFPSGDSQQGVADLAGNVWEWCRNEYSNPTQTQPGGKRPRVLRGGSWLVNPGRARADYRSLVDPNYRVVDIGFRVVCSSPIR